LQRPTTSSRLALQRTLSSQASIFNRTFPAA
jgi:hypothetical protein